MDKFRFVFFVSTAISLISLSAPPALALNYRDLENVNEMVKPDKYYLSPLNGFNFSRTPILKNALSLKMDPDLDSFLVALYPQRTLSPESRPLQPISFLTPAAIGKVLNRLDTTSQLEFTSLPKNKTKWAESKLVQDLVKMMLDGIYEKEIEDEARTKEQLSKKLAEQQKKLEPQSVAEGSCVHPEQAIEETRQKIVQLEKQLAEVNLAMMIAKNQKIGLSESKKKITKFVKDLITCYLKDRAEGGHPPHFVEGTLMAFALSKASGKQDLLNLLRELPGALSEKGKEVIKDPLKKATWLSTRVNPVKYKALLKRVRSGEVDVNTLDPETISILAYVDTTSLLPPLLNYGRAHYTSKKGGEGEEAQTHELSDCVESAVRGIFNFFLYDPTTGEFDPSFLQRVSDELHVEPEAGVPEAFKRLKAFYSKNVDPSGVDDSHVRDEWVQSVLSGHKSLNFKNKDLFELRSSPENVLATFELLLGDKELAKLEGNQDKWNRICQIFAAARGEEYSIGCKASGDRVDFTYNGAPAFHMNVSVAHEQVAGHAGLHEDEGYTSGSPFRDQSGSVLVKRLQHKSESAMRNSLGFYVTPNNFESMIEALPKEYNESDLSTLIYSLPFYTNSGTSKALAIRSIMLKGEKRLFPLAKKLLAEIPKADLKSRLLARNAILKATPEGQSKATWIKEWNLDQAGVTDELYRHRESAIRIAFDHGLTFILDEMKAKKAEFEFIRKGSLEGDFIGNPVIFWAISLGHPELIEFLLENKISNLNEEGDYNILPFQAAAYEGKVEIMKLLLKKDPSMLTNKGKRNESPLFLAADRGEFNAVQFILERLGEKGEAEAKKVLALLQKETPDDEVTSDSQIEVRKCLKNALKKE